MKKNGFTIIELLVSFTLTSVVMIFLLQIVIMLKDLYVKVGFQTELQNETGAILKLINDDFIRKGVVTINSCGINCYTIGLGSLEEKNLLVDRDKRLISYGKNNNVRAVKLPKGAIIGDISVQLKNTQYDANAYNFIDENEILLITIPVTSTFVNTNPNDIRIVYQKIFSLH